MKTETINIAVVGLGHIAQTIHLPLWSKMNGASLYGVYDIQRIKREALAKKYNAIEYKSFEELLNDDNVDAIHICTPTHTHAELTLKAIEAQKHVLVEKPIARDLDEAKMIHDAWKDQNKIVMVGMNQRFRPDVMILRGFIEQGELGNIYYIKGGWNKPIRDAHSWRLKKNQAGGGVLLDLGLVMIDLSLWLANYPHIESVSAMTFHHQIETVEDTAIFQAKFDGGVINLECSWSPLVENDQLFLRFYGDKGTATLFPFKINKLMADNLVDITPHSIGSEKVNFSKSYERELRHFVGAVKGHHRAICTPRGAIERMQLIDSVYKSARKDKSIKV